MVFKKIVFQKRYVALFQITPVLNYNIEFNYKIKGTHSSHFVAIC